MAIPLAATTLILLPAPFSHAQDTLSPPVAKRVPKVDTVNGEVRIDNYFWLRDKANPEVIAYLEAENRYTEAAMSHAKPLKEKIYQELVRRIKETDLDVPEKIDDYFYYTRSEQGKQYRIYCRKRGALDAPEEILLDHNEVAQGHKQCGLGVLVVSPDHQLLAYSIDTTGGEEYALYVKDLASGKLRPDAIPRTSTGVEWAADNRTIFYTTLDETKRPYRLFRHVLGTDPKNDSLIYQEDDGAFYLDISKTKSRAYLLLTLESETSSEVRYLAADNPSGPFQIISPRRKDIEYSVVHHGDRFFINTNDNARNFKVMSAPVTDPAAKNWQEIIRHRDSIKVEHIDAFADHLAIYERENGLEQIRILNFKTGEQHRVTFPEPVYSYSPGRNPEYKSRLLRFTYTSLVTPRSVYDYDMETKTRELKKQYEVQGGYDASQYQSERLFATATDGTRVPISVVYKRGLVKDGKSPLLLYGYGAYGISEDPWFSSSRLSLLDRGFVFAIAHVRGGGEMGRYWYDQGKLLNKKNSFGDFIACAEYLISQKFTSTERLAIEGGSAGGLLIGAVTMTRPDLFHVVVADVPFVDVINTMLDETIPLTVIEFDEWGNPKKKEFYDYMRSYSPYDNVAAKAYPDMLITAGLNDPRVGYWEPAKWTAKLRALKTDHHILLLKTEMGEGHLGASGRYDMLKDIAFEYAFLLDRMGITQ